MERDHKMPRLKPNKRGLRHLLEGDHVQTEQTDEDILYQGTFKPEDNKKSKVEGETLLR